MNITHRQHYVQQKYLRHWEDDNQLFIYEKLKDKGKIRIKGTNAICFDWDYYKLDRLTKDEKRIFNVLYKNIPAKLKRQIEELNGLLDYSIEIESPDKEIKNTVSDIFCKHRQEIEDAVFTQFGESLLCDIEKCLSDKLWEKLLSKDETFITDEHERIDFLSYVIGQMWRVPAKRKKLEEVLKKLNAEKGAEVSAERMFPFFVYYQSIIETIYMSYYNKHKLIYLSIPNDSYNEFITSDNPVLNLCKDFDSDGSPKTYNLYLAVTPKIAVIITENSTEHSREATDEEIWHLNKLVFDNATRYVISHKKENLLSVINIGM